MSVRDSDFPSQKDAKINSNLSDATAAVSRNSIGSGWRTLACVLADVEKHAELRRLAAAKADSDSPSEEIERACPIPTQIDL